ncbi:hypothetical protein ACWKSP_03840 [Micromonosporaceae bacterium Da 78-11]
MTGRADLMALDEDALGALANRGLVKRAAREVAKEPPALDVGVDATVVAAFSDGVRAELPVGGLDRGRCSCGAHGVCRHLISLVLAYQRAEASGTAAPADEGPAAAVGDEDRDGRGAGPGWSPGDFTDAALTVRIGARLMTVARRAERAGFAARVRRGDAADPVPVVELGSATVRFLVPRDLGYVHTDAGAGRRDEVIALAVWAFRVADRRFPDRADCRVEVGGGTVAAGASGLETVVELAGEVLRSGATHLGAGLAAAVAVQARQLERDGLHWPLQALDEVAGQLTAYRERSARYAPEVLAGLVAELFARHRAVLAGGASLRSRVLGTQEPAETPMRRVRLDGLGARVSAAGDRRSVDVYHAHAATGVVLVSHRAWETEDEGPALGRRRVAGSTVAGLAAGTVLTESAVRSASRAVRLATSRVAPATVTASAGAWDELPPGLLVRDFGRLAAELDALPPRPVRARVEAELVRVLAVADVLGMRYEAGRQRLTVQVTDAAGGVATVAVTHAAAVPGRLDAVAAAFSGTRGTPRFVAGTVHRNGCGVWLDPSAVAADGAPIVPDLAVPDPVTVFGAGGMADEPDPLGEAVGRARDVLVDGVHIGLAHLPRGYGERLSAAAASLAGVGLSRIAESVRRLGGLLGPDPGEEAIGAWVDAFLRVDMAAESL